MAEGDFPAVGAAEVVGEAGKAFPFCILNYFFLAFLASSFSISTASREMFLRRWRRKNQIKTKMEQPKTNKPYLIGSDQLVAKRIKALAIPRQMVYK